MLQCKPLEVGKPYALCRPSSPAVSRRSRGKCVQFPCETRSPEPKVAAFGDVAGDLATYVVALVQSMPARAASQAVPVERASAAQPPLHDFRKAAHHPLHRFDHPRPAHKMSKRTAVVGHLAFTTNKEKEREKKLKGKRNQGKGGANRQKIT